MYMRNVVEHQQQRAPAHPDTTGTGPLPPSHSPTARSSALAFSRISSYSASGSDCTTIAPPAPIDIRHGDAAAAAPAAPAPPCETAGPWPSPSMTAVRMTMLRSKVSFSEMNPMHPEYTPRARPSRVSMIRIPAAAQRRAARHPPVMEPPGKAARMQSIADVPALRTPRTVDTIWCTVAYDSMSIRPGTCTLPTCGRAGRGGWPRTSHTRPRSLRSRSTIMRFSARSFSEAASSAAAAASAAGFPATRAAVPLMGRASSRPPRSPRRKRSGEEQQIGAGLSRRRLRYSAAGSGAAGRVSAVAATLRRVKGTTTPAGAGACAVGGAAGCGCATVEASRLPHEVGLEATVAAAAVQHRVGRGAGVRVGGAALGLELVAQPLPRQQLLQVVQEAAGRGVVGGGGGCEAERGVDEEEEPVAAEAPLEEPGPGPAASAWASLPPQALLEEAASLSASELAPREGGASRCREAVASYCGTRPWLPRPWAWLSPPQQDGQPQRGAALVRRRGPGRQRRQPDWRAHQIGHMPAAARGRRCAAARSRKLRMSATP
ncbi:hypothetical protein TSOC_009193 [Tetrabaena socialis]|uniref:Uncharacterized protein n=1 Tax=Tetrabaena socialis TaxID=47790 RepID=A0A2J7ZWJ2_9CHLO|nr:hypothetical protein TSOC_009193 [Tetrabaena socialis]|eukprot:PNH04615.1 hypothetical protein TSOC_009193 [Tetrabaena socialis]